MSKNSNRSEWLQNGHHLKTNEELSFDEFVKRVAYLSSYSNSITLGDLKGKRSDPSTAFFLNVPKVGRFRVAMDCKVKSLFKLISSGYLQVGITKRGTQVLSNNPDGIPGVYIYLL